ncbi:MAG: acyltransferase [Actinomycetota bacterium]
MGTFIEPTAVVEDGAVIGDDTKVWALSQIRPGARVGSECNIGRNVFVDEGVIVGDRCKVQNNALLYAPAVLGDGVFIGPAVVLTNDRHPRAVNADLSLKDASDWDADGITIEDGAAVGARTVIVAGTRIGAWSLIGAGSTVTRDTLPYGLYVGAPARRVGWVGTEGVRLEPAGDGRWRCPVSGDEFVEADGRLTPA